MTMSSNVGRSGRLVTGIVGASLGLAIGVVVGVLTWSVASRGNTPAMMIPLNATATHGADNHALATGPLDNDVEMVFFLDALTGDLKAAAINVRRRQFQAFYARNIQQDFSNEKIKNPKYLLVTGQADMPRQGNTAPIGQCAAYVMEVTSGKCVAYAVPLPVNRKSSTQDFSYPLVPIDRVEFRQVQVRAQGQANIKGG